MVAKKRGSKEITSDQANKEPIPLPRRIAIAAAAAPFASVAASEQFTKAVHPDLDIVEMATVIRGSMNRVKAGDMSDMEEMLVGQAHALQQVFVSLMRRTTEQGALKNYQAFMGMGLKAQAQCRATIQALTELKYPRQVVIAKQANISNGHQQVNNGALEPTHATEKTIEQNELLEVSHEQAITQRLDTRAKATAGRNDRDMATVGEVHRSQDAGG